MRSGCLAAPALVPATTLKQADLFAAVRNLWPNIPVPFLPPVAINYNGSNAVKEHGSMPCRIDALAAAACGLNPATRTSIREFLCLTTCRTSRTGRSSATQFCITREIAHQPALDQYRGREISPCVECQTDEQLDEFRNHAETAFHPWYLQNGL